MSRFEGEKMEPASHVKTIETAGIASTKAQTRKSLEHLKTRKEGGVVGALWISRRGWWRPDHIEFLYAVDCYNLIDLYFIRIYTFCSVIE